MKKKKVQVFFVIPVDVIPHPPYSPDIAPCDFWLFGELKTHLRNKGTHSYEETESETRAFLGKITVEKLESVYSEWKRRCMAVIRANGEYIE